MTILAALVLLALLLFIMHRIGLLVISTTTAADEQWDAMLDFSDALDDVERLVERRCEVGAFPIDTMPGELLDVAQTLIDDVRAHPDITHAVDVEDDDAQWADVVAAGYQHLPRRERMLIAAAYVIAEVARDDRAEREEAPSDAA